MFSLVFVLVLSLVSSSEGSVSGPRALNAATREWFSITHDFDYYLNKNTRPPKPDDTWKSINTQIFVGISSLHDDRCGRTLHSLITQAENPNRVHIGVVQQNNDNTNDCIDGYCAMMQGKEYTQLPNPYDSCPYLDNIRTIRLKASEAKGPQLARGLQMRLINGEEFCLQIDAHSFGDKNWDTKLLNNWGMCDNEMAILTTYVGSPENLGKNVGSVHEVPHLCTAGWNGPFPFNDRASAARDLKRPILAPLWAAGLSFSKCHAEILVPYDINLIQIWTGEEFGRGARLWTHGYDFYSPTAPIIAHDYSPGKEQKNWHADHNEYLKSEKRLKSILKVKNSDQSKEYISQIGKFNLGNKRTIEQYINFCGVDIINHEILFDQCRDYEYIPYKYSNSQIQNIRLLGKYNKNKLLNNIKYNKKNKKSQKTTKQKIIVIIILFILFSMFLFVISQTVLKHGDLTWSNNSNNV